ncbi:hypothetical protein E4U42_005901 [Claviceps africana]|uniref:Glycosyl hydrolase family 13 catalytic domain-containing protein n=1 Tax=Claviceps africana TaxID=83212 RepID=A0A8K0JC41_9HYPO|nr:hypothetical protein E4U42_005901 [Claviceps africana]
MDLDHGVDGKFSPKTWSLSELKTKVNKWQRFMFDNNGWNALYLENHDQPRAVSRFAHDGPENREASAKLIAIFLAFQAGTPFIYQGQEIGMTNMPVEWDMDEYKDIDCLNHWSMYRDSADETAKALLKEEYRKKSRDNARTPMQWDNSPQAGFTTSATPWMRVHDNYKEINAASQVDDAASVFQIYRLSLAKRKEHKDLFVYGDFELVDEKNDKIFAYKRVASNGEAALVVCNFSKETVAWASNVNAKEVLVTSTGKTLDDLSGGEMRLNAFEAIAFLI